MGGLFVGMVTKYAGGIKKVSIVSSLLRVRLSCQWLLYQAEGALIQEPGQNGAKASSCMASEFIHHPLLACSFLCSCLALFMPEFHCDRWASGNRSRAVPSRGHRSIVLGAPCVASGCCQYLIVLFLSTCKTRKYEDRVKCLMHYQLSQHQ